MKTKSWIKAGFSLVEVAMAIGICSFCMITLLGILPVSIHNFQRADNQTYMLNIATSVEQDLKSTPAGAAATTSPRYSLVIPALNSTPTTQTTPQTVFLNASGDPTSGATDPASIYRLSVAFATPPSGSLAATSARVIVTFPARADVSATTWPVNYTSKVQTTVSLNRN
jgi:uncharacterized protein (TIGR02598 family)